MARKRRTPDADAHAVTIDRAARLCRLVRLTAGSGFPRAKLLQKLKIDLRGFYRDLQLLRVVGVDVLSDGGNYVLSGAENEAMDRLPCPNPQLTLGDAKQLSKGRGDGPRKLRQVIKAIRGAGV